MISKHIVGRFTSGCSHSTPILVQCPECIERQLLGWEQRIRDECKLDLTDEMKRAKEDAVHWKKEIENVMIGREMLLQTIAGLRKDKQNLITELDESKRRAEDLRVQLHADQASKQDIPHYRTFTE